MAATVAQDFGIFCVKFEITGFICIL